MVSTFSATQSSSVPVPHYLEVPKKPEPQMTLVHPLVNGKPDYSRSLRIPADEICLFSGTSKSWGELEQLYG